MNIIYDTGIEKYFIDYRLMQKKIGQDMTRTVKKRINALWAANNLSVFLTTGLGNPHSIDRILSGCYAASVTANYRLIFKPNMDGYNAEAFRRCTEVTIKGVDGYHGGKNEWIIP